MASFQTDNTNLATKTLVKRLAIGIPVALIALIIAFGSHFNVDQGYAGIVTQFGKLDHVASSGFNWKLPLVQDVVHFETRTQKVDSFKTEAYSKDIQEATYTLSVNYHLDESKVAELFTNLGTQYQTRLLDPTILRVLKEQTGKFVATDIIGQRDKLGAAITATLAEELKQHGIIVEQVQLENVVFDPAFEKSVNDRMVAEVNVQKEKQILEQKRINAEQIKVQADADAYSTRVTAEADAFKVKQEADASAYTTRVDGTATAEAAKVKIAAFGSAVAYTDWVIAQTWKGEVPATMVPGGSIPFVNLPHGK